MVNRALFNQFLDWVKGEVDAGRVQVKTVHEVARGSLQPQVAMAPAPVRTGNLLLNPSFEQLWHGHDARRLLGQHQQRPRRARPSLATTNDAHEGSKALTISVPAAYDSWAYNMIAPSLDLAQCAPTAVPGHDYTFSGWYKGNGQIKIVAYWRNADNFWQRLSWGPGGSATFPAAAGWTHASFSFAAPAGATAISAGFDRRRHRRRSDGRQQLHDRRHEPGRRRRRSARQLRAGGERRGRRHRHRHERPGRHRLRRHLLEPTSRRSSVTLTAAAAGELDLRGLVRCLLGRRRHLHRDDRPGRTRPPRRSPCFPSGAHRHQGGSRHRLGLELPAGIDCGATCQTSFDHGTTVALTAAPAGGSVFAGWSGACSGSATTCTVAITAATSATATFTLLPGQLTVSKAGTGSGAITSPAGIACGAACSATVANGTTVSLTVAAAPGSAFTGWSGALLGLREHLHRRDGRGQVGRRPRSPCGGDDLTVSKAGTGTGTVTSSRPASRAA